VHAGIETVSYLLKLFFRLSCHGPSASKDFSVLPTVSSHKLKILEYRPIPQTDSRGRRSGIHAVRLYPTTSYDEHNSNFLVQHAILGENWRPDRRSSRLRCPRISRLDESEYRRWQWRRTTCIGVLTHAASTAMACYLDQHRPDRVCVLGNARSRSPLEQISWITRV